MDRDDDDVAGGDAWPELRLADWRATCATLHMWTQVVGKVRMALTPPLNHWWHVPLYVSARGLTTSPMPHGERNFAIAFDFVGHNLHVDVNDGRRRALPLVPRPVSAFYEELMHVLVALDLPVDIWRMPVEVPEPIPFDEDQEHASYDAAAANRFFRVLSQVDRVLRQFAGRFQGKQSPVHFFWGSFDMAATRFSGREAPPRPNADGITREAYSHEVMSFGFWPGTPGLVDASFYAYAAPEPAGFRDADPGPAAAAYSEELREFLLPYEAVRRARDPRALVLDFCQHVYDAGATLGRWDRDVCDRVDVAVAAPDESPSLH